ncbi:hypothetical protein QYE76_003587 [Lolium multiflorum]|uniref:RING-type domain-containing protein n=1 Tax=Lolium multiflorum TaxID=4521 RepID=A0AAD8RR17_LOLMU|nr:hypothetical protein QYE76_003587 [Lolium multiflorum]
MESAAQGGEHVGRGAGDVTRRRRRGEEDEVERSYREKRERRHPVSRQDMLALPMAKAGETREDECPICLHDFLPGGKELRTMPCSHSFHEQCIFDWLVIDRRCPICRFVMPSEEPRWRILEEDDGLEIIEEDDEVEEDEDEDELFRRAPATVYHIVDSFIFDGSRPYNGMYDFVI